MAPFSYYYVLSLALLGGALLVLLNFICIKLWSQLMFGRVTRVGTPQHDSLLKLASKRNILVTSVVVLALSANLVYSISLILNLDSSYKYGFLIVTAVIIVVAYALIVIFQRIHFKDYLDKSTDKKQSNSKSDKSDSWLS